MKKNYPLFCLFFFAAILLLAGCKKSSTSKSRTELLTQAPWLMVDAGADIDENGTVDLSQLIECMEDNILTLNTNGTGVMNEGADICPGEPATSDFGWVFKNNEQVVNIDIEVLGDVNILTLNETDLKVYKDVDNGMGGTFRALFIFGR